MGKDQKYSIIGPGVMGEALIIGLLTNEEIDPGNILAAGPHQDRLDELMDRYNIQTTLNNTNAVQDADVIILSVKPQKLPQVIVDLRNEIPQDTLVISIIAGATMDSLITGLNHPLVVRSMPNTPAQVGEGMTVWTQSQQTSESQHALAAQILGALGQSIYVGDEGYIDMATAVSGTGPAYVFLFLESMIDAGVHLGLPRRIAEEMVIQTLKGSIAYYTQNSSHPARLRNQVTSPGGTSATALYYLEKMGFRTAISRAIWAAFTRSKELGKGHMHQDPERSERQS
ncbi:MAG: pyrroline-5-carboxylate reductase [Chloroflexota bacterium]|nr:pyrroline-5-carboxylate reductase [Chloroflexota bacterium]